MSAPLTYRLALVLNGGVSLAVWMSGVVHELDLICRASVPGSAPRAGDDPEHFARWKELIGAKEISGSNGVRIEIDIVAGTSAGGLNGAILATALANAQPLPDLRSLWDQSATLTPAGLLHDPGPDGLTSVLDGAYLRRKIRDTLEPLVTDTPGPGPGAEVTLFTTATAFGVSDRNYTDIAGGRFTVADHRRLYRFRVSHSAYRFEQADDPEDDGFTPYDVNDFSGGLEALTCAARASASFPGAFDPEQENDALAARRHPPVPGKPPSGGTWLMDGGILDNAPIEPVLREITSRPVDGAVRRMVVYVVPSDGVVAWTPPPAPPDRRPGPTEILGAAVTLPRESDFRSDVDALIAALGADQARQNAAGGLFQSAIGDQSRRTTLIEGATALLGAYRANRFAATVQEVRDGVERGQGTPARLAAPNGSASYGVPVPPAPWVPDEYPTTVTAGDRWPYGLSGATRTVRVLLRVCRAALDPDYGHAPSPVPPPATAPEPGALAAHATTLTTLLAKIETLRGVVTADAENRVRNRITGTDPTVSDELVAKEIRESFATYDVTATLGILVGAAVADHAAAFERPVTTVMQVLTAVEIVTGGLAARPEDVGPPPFEFLRLGPDVPSVTFDTADALGENKLYGTRLGHFGAFGLPEWRSWDFMWGRLDAATHLARLLALSQDQATDLETGIATHERSAASTQQALNDVRSDLSEIAAATEPAALNRDLLDQMRADPDGRTALLGLADSVLRLLGPIYAALPAQKPPPVLATLGHTARVLLGRDAPPGMHGAAQRLLRAVSGRFIRPRLWAWFTPPAVADRSTSSRRRPWILRALAPRPPHGE